MSKDNLSSDQDILQRVEEMEYPWRDEEVLRYFYHDQKMPQAEVAEEIGCAEHTVSNWMREFDIERRTHAESYALHYDNPNDVTWETTRTGHEMWYRREGTVCIHRLAAVAKFGFDAVADKEVHHKNGIPWDNRPENIEVMSKSEHSTTHKKIDGVDRIRVAELYENGDCPYRVVHEQTDYDVSESTILAIHHECYREGA